MLIDFLKLSLIVPISVPFHLQMTTLRRRMGGVQVFCVLQRRVKVSQSDSVPLVTYDLDSQHHIIEVTFI